MNTLWILALVAGVIPTILAMKLDPEMQAMVDMLHDSCVDDSGVTDELLARARKGDFADDMTLKNYMKCLYVSTAAMSDDGVLDVDAMISMIPDEMEMKPLAVKVIMTCKDSKGADAAETAFLLNKCFYDTEPTNYFLL